MSNRRGNCLLYISLVSNSGADDNMELFNFDIFKYSDFIYVLSGEYRCVDHESEKKKLIREKL